MTKDSQGAGSQAAAVAKRGHRTGRRPYLVAVGASAGGLKALGTMLSGLPADFSAPIMAVIHLDPDHQSHLPELLQRETRLRVQAAKSGQVLAAGSVYVASPDRHLEVQGNKIRLTRARKVRFSRPSIDRLFSSVAKSYENRAIAVVLSGTGADGSAGVQEVRAHGGTVIAEHASTAQFPSMPQNAARTGCVDMELAVEKIPAALILAVSHDVSEAAPKEWPVVLSLLREKFGTDFSGYRPTTLKRRLERRVLATGQPDLPSYLRLVRQKPAELERLHSEFLIKVSSFFRDREEWGQLAQKVIRPLVREAPTAAEFRVWCVGCATGEEAYTTAILFSEAMRDGSPARIKVFATDLDENALSTARLGTYTAAQASVIAPALLRRYFDREGDGWRVKKNLRKIVIFGKHDLLRDTPLTAMDLIVCRNVLIYLTPDQGRVALQRLAFAMKPGGYLFLGRSEGGRRPERGVDRVPGSPRLFRRSAAPLTMVSRASRPSRPASNVDLRDEIRRGNHALLDGAGLRDLLLEAATVSLFVVDAAGRISFWNKAAESLFGVRSRHAMGSPIADAVGATFWDGLRDAARQAGATHRPVRVPRLDYLPAGRQPRYLELDCIPLRERGQHAGGFLFIAVDATERFTAQTLQNELVDRLRGAGRETRQASEALQSANEELETLNEELQSTSEEQQTLNEELESRNEELSTVNEELQSLNQELNTLNEEVGARIAEADRLNAYLRAVLDLSPNAVVGCDLRHRVTFWNSPATRQFRLSAEQAIGKNLFDLVPVLDVPAVRKAMDAPNPLSEVRVDKGPGYPLGLTVGLRNVRDRADRRQGHLLWISEGRPIESLSSLPMSKPPVGKKRPAGREG